MFGLFELKELIPHALWAGIGGGFGYFWVHVRAWIRTRGHRALFTGLEAPLLFVFPPRTGSASTLIPRMAIEDFLAINNIVSAYLQIGLNPPDKIRDTGHLTPQDKKQNNLILICSSKSNTSTREALDLLRSRNGRLKDLVPYFDDVPGVANQIQIKCDHAIYPSASYEAIGKCVPRTMRVHDARLVRHLAQRAQHRGATNAEIAKHILPGGVCRLPHCLQQTLPQAADRPCER